MRGSGHTGVIVAFSFSLCVCACVRDRVRASAHQMPMKSFLFLPIRACFNGANRGPERALISFYAHKTRGNVSTLFQIEIC